MPYTISSLHIYPIKSLGGISLTQCHALVEGFQYDRRWMLVDADGQFLTQRNHATMALFQCQIEGDNLQISFKGDTQSMSLDTHSADVREVQVWSSKLKAHVVSEHLSEWFSDHLAMSATLVKMTDVSSRTKLFTKPPFTTQVSLADGYPYLILGQASMDHLNTTLDTQLMANRFRANIIVDTQKPHEEDDWTNISIGSSKLRVLSPCARCQVTTIDQATAIKGKEPLKSLAQYRKEGQKIYFGANTMVRQEGIIKVGDTLILE